MLSRLRNRLTFANAISLLALFVALGGSGYAATVAKDSVGARQIKANAVGPPEIKKGAVRSSEVANGSLLAQDFRAGALPEGPRGPAGRDGVNGAANVVYRRADSAPLTQNSYARMTVGCRPGERLIGGGAGFPFTSASGSGNTDLYDLYQQVATSGPGILINPTNHLARAVREGETPNVWYASGYQAEVNPHTLTVHAICASP